MARPRDEPARQRILGATCDLVGERGPRKVRIEDIAERAGVARQTIYRWWPSKSDVLIDALIARTDALMPFDDSGSTRTDLADQMNKVVDVFNSPTGAVIRELVADGQGDTAIAEAFRERFLNHRRQKAIERLQRGIERGEIAHQPHPEAVIDLLYGPLWMRLLLGHQPLTETIADELLDVVWPGLTTGDDAPAGERTA